jgi:hypothetical protein
VTPTTWAYVSIIALAAWIIGGFIWLFPKKLRLIRRVGYGVTNAQLNELAKRGDVEARRLKKLGIGYMALGLLILLVLAIMKPH